MCSWLTIKSSKVTFKVSPHCCFLSVLWKQFMTAIFQGIFPSASQPYITDIHLRSLFLEQKPPNLTFKSRKGQSCAHHLLGLLTPLTKVN